jgi:hypothetical protein
MEQLIFHWTEFHEISCLSFFLNLSTKFKVDYNMTRWTPTLREDQYIFSSYLVQFFLEWEMFLAKVIQENTNFMFRNMFSKAMQFVRYWVKYGSSGQATDDNVAHALCLLDT